MRDTFTPFSQWPQWLAPPFLERLTLAMNHILRAEPAATARMAPFAGRRIVVHLEGWPVLLPAVPPLHWLITPAGLLEWGGVAAPEGAPDLRIVVDACNPAGLMARAMAGERPEVQIEGDAMFAAEVGWLLQNLRWDVAADLERLFGPVVAHQVHQAGRALARALRTALDAFAKARPPATVGDLGTRLGEAANKAATTAANIASEGMARFTGTFGPGPR